MATADSALVASGASASARLPEGTAAASPSELWPTGRALSNKALVISDGSLGSIRRLTRIGGVLIDSRL